VDAKKTSSERANARIAAREAFERAKARTAARAKFNDAMAKADAIADAMIQRGDHRW
jgi:hypothetical protein